MKNLILGIILAFASVSAFASGQNQVQLGQTNAQSQSTSTAASGSVSANQGQGNGNNVTLEAAPIPDNITIKNVPSVNGPNLTTSNDTCMGSTSGSVNIAGLGIGGGSTWTDANCKRLKNARELWNMGMKAASLALMCGDADNKEALELTGYVCPTKPAAKPAEKTAAKSADKTATVTANANSPYPNMCSQPYGC